ncbi:MAG: NAD(P)-dependent oxidoreductase [Rubrivivax sp.]
MDLLIVEPLDPEVVQWLEVRFRVQYEPDLAREPLALRRLLHGARAIISPPGVALDEPVLNAAPRLRAIGRLSAGAENIDLEACARAGVEVVRSPKSSAAAEAEFAIGALLQLLRRVPVENAEGLMVGRELGGATVGLVGMTPAARPLSQLLAAFGATVCGYDPALAPADPLWSGWGVRRLSLNEVFEQSDAVCVLLGYASRYRRLIGERYLAYGKMNQVIVSLTTSSVFDEAVLARALGSARIAAAWFDSLEPGALDRGRPLAEVGNLQVTPRVAGTTRESRLRSAWAVARRIDEILSAPVGATRSRDALAALRAGGVDPLPAAPQGFRPTAPDDVVDLADDPDPG